MSIWREGGEAGGTSEKTHVLDIVGVRRVVLEVRRGGLFGRHSVAAVSECAGEVIGRTIQRRIHTNGRACAETHLARYFPRVAFPEKVMKRALLVASLCLLARRA